MVVERKTVPPNYPNALATCCSHVYYHRTSVSVSIETDELLWNGMKLLLRPAR